MNKNRQIKTTFDVCLISSLEAHLHKIKTILARTTEEDYQKVLHTYRMF